MCLTSEEKGFYRGQAPAAAVMKQSDSDNKEPPSQLSRSALQN